GGSGPRAVALTDERTRLPRHVERDCRKLEVFGRRHRGSRCDAAALLVLFAAATRAGVVAPDLRPFAHDGGTGGLFTVDEKPASVLLAERRDLAMVDGGAFDLVP